jgi:hypothetical protein
MITSDRGAGTCPSVTPEQGERHDAPRLPHLRLEAGLYGLPVIPLDDPAAGVEGRSWAYVSLVDNATNDPVNLW